MGMRKCFKFGWKEHAAARATAYPAVPRARGNREICVAMRAGMGEVFDDFGSHQAAPVVLGSFPSLERLIASILTRQSRKGSRQWADKPLSTGRTGAYDALSWQSTFARLRKPIVRSSAS